jgi:hypothetical protein
MIAIDAILFDQFVEAMNGELAAIGTTLRIADAPPSHARSMTLEDANGRPLGIVPDYVDAATIAALEVILVRREAVPWT